MATPLISDILDAALGRSPFDLVIRGAQVVNVYTHSVGPRDIGVLGDRIVLVGEVSDASIGTATEILDWSGKYVVPGFMDPHFHIGGSQLSVPELARALLRRGTTTIVSDLQEIYAYAGVRGVRHVLDEAADCGLRVLHTPAVHLLGLEDRGRYRHAVSGAEMIEMLDWPEVVGINEPPPVMVLGRNQSTLEVMAAAETRGLVIPGHLPGVTGLELGAYAAVGPSSDHESQTAPEALEKLELGLWVMMREGSAAVDLENVLPLLQTTPGAARWSMVCSDEQDAPDIVGRGNIDEKIRILVRNGVDPIVAVAMGTINPALYFRVDHILGAVVPGRAADLVAVSDLTQFDVEDVVSAGRVVVRNGKLQLPGARRTYPDYLRSDVRWPRPLSVDDLSIAASGEKVRVRLIWVEDGSLVSGKREAELPVIEGCVGADEASDVLKMAVIDRHSGDMRVGLGFIAGLGLKRGAVATTYNHVHYNALIIGSSDQEMVAAASELARLGGGVVVVQDGEIISRWPLDLVGVFSTEPLEDAQAALAASNDALKQIGCTFSSPILGLSFVALTTIPGYGMTEYGLFDVDSQTFIPTVIE